MTWIQRAEDGCERTIQRFEAVCQALTRLPGQLALRTPKRALCVGLLAGLGIQEAADTLATRQAEAQARLLPEAAWLTGSCRAAAVVPQVDGSYTLNLPAPCSIRFNAVAAPRQPLHAFPFRPSASAPSAPLPFASAPSAPLPSASAPFVPSPQASTPLFPRAKLIPPGLRAA